MPVFLDTNIVCYAFVKSPKWSRSLALLHERPILSTQILNEFSNVARRKWHYDWRDIDDAVNAILSYADSIRPVDLETNELGRMLAERYQFQLYDSFVVASALLADCNTLYSEDMQDGMVIENHLTIRNPFV